MTDTGSDMALQSLATGIRRCVETLGSACTAGLLATVALDLSESGGGTLGQASMGEATVGALRSDRSRGL